MNDEELMRIAFADKRTVQEILRYIFELGEQKGRADALDEYVAILKKELVFYDKHGELIVKLAEQLKEQKNE